MSTPNLVDAQRISNTTPKKKTKALRGETAKKVLEKLAKKPEKKGRTASEVRTAMYGKGTE